MKANGGEKSIFNRYSGGRFAAGLGADAAALAVCSAFAIICTLFLKAELLSAAITGISVITATVFTRNMLHGILTSVFAALAGVILLGNTLTLHPLLAYFLLLVIYLAMAVLVGGFIGQLSSELKKTKQQYDQAKLINDINQRLLLSPASESLELITLESMCELTGKPGVVYQHGEDGIKSCCMIPRWLIVYPSELNAAEACFDTGKRCGVGTDSFSSSSFMYIPVISRGEVMCVVAMRFGFDKYPGEELLTAMDLIVSQAALALARRELIDEQHSILMESEKEKIRNDFLRAISHDLRTPLAGIISACSTIEESDDRLSAGSRVELVQDIHTEAEWLLRMVENLLSVTRVSGGPDMLKTTLEPVDEIIWDAVERIRLRYPEAEVRVNTPEEVLLVEMDATLIVQVLTNLMENAIKYSGGGWPVDVSVIREPGAACFTVRDHGNGLSAAAINALFKATAVRDGGGNHGLGIGLSICRTIVMAHGGQIEGANGEDGGAIFRFTLPMEDE